MMTKLVLFLDLVPLLPPLGFGVNGVVGQYHSYSLR